MNYLFNWWLRYPFNWFLGPRGEAGHEEETVQYAHLHPAPATGQPQPNILPTCFHPFSSPPSCCSLTYFYLLYYLAVDSLDFEIIALVLLVFFLSSVDPLAVHLPMYCWPSSCLVLACWHPNFPLLKGTVSRDFFALVFFSICSFWSY